MTKLVNNVNYILIYEVDFITFIFHKLKLIKCLKVINKLNLIYVKKKLIKLFPQKSIFGYEIINAKQSIFLALIFIFLNIFINRFFGFEKIRMIAGNIFFLISNASIFILILNSYLREEIKYSSSLYIYRIFLTVYIPFGLFFIYKNISHISNLLFNK